MPDYPVKELITLKVTFEITHDGSDESRNNAIANAINLSKNSKILGYPISVTPKESKLISKSRIWK
jgi:hypothetical protein